MPDAGTQHDPIARLRGAADVLRRQNDPNMHEVADGLDAFLAGRAESLDAALEVAGQQSQRKPVSRALLAERDELLRQAAAEFFPGRSARQQAAELHRVIARYAASAWPRDRAAVACPGRLDGTVQAVAWQVLRLESHTLSEERIRKVLASAAGS